MLLTSRRGTDKDGCNNWMDVKVHFSGIPRIPDSFLTIIVCRVNAKHDHLIDLLLMLSARASGTEGRRALWVSKSDSEYLDHPYLSRVHGWIWDGRGVFH